MKAAAQSSFPFGRNGIRAEGGRPPSQYFLFLPLNFFWVFSLLFNLELW